MNEEAKTDVKTLPLWPEEVPELLALEPAGGCAECLDGFIEASTGPQPEEIPCPHCDVSETVELRRVIEPQPGPMGCSLQPDGRTLVEPGHPYPGCGEDFVTLPYAVGDRLAGLEEFHLAQEYDSLATSRFLELWPDSRAFLYAYQGLQGLNHKLHGFAIKRPGIEMPPQFSRLPLEVAALRVERLMDIRGKDTLIVVPKAKALSDGPPLEGDIWKQERATYFEIWDRHNPGHPASSNPWVAVPTVRRAG